MKKIVLSLVCLSATMIAFAGIIVTKNDGNIEDVSNIVVSNTEVSFVESGTSKSLPIDKVSAVLYDDGRYEEIQHKSSNYQEDSFQETYTNVDNETRIEYSTNTIPNNNNVAKEERLQQRAQRRAESKETMKAMGNWIKSAFKGDKDGWNPAKNPLWNKESREKYSSGSASETQSPTPSSSNDPAQSNDNNW